MVDPNQSVTEVAKQIGQKWRSLSDTERQSYQQKYAEARAKFTEAKSLNEDEPLLELVRVSNSVRLERLSKRSVPKHVKEMIRQLPALPSRSGYAVFSREQFGHLNLAGKPLSGVQTVMKGIASKWSALTADERERYNAQAIDDQKRFTNELKQFVSQRRVI